MTKKKAIDVNVDQMTIDGQPIKEEILHIIYAVGRRGSPTRSEIASQLTKVGIDAEKRASLIAFMSEAGIVGETKLPGIGKRGKKASKLSLSICGAGIYENYFGQEPVQAGGA